MKKRIQIKQLTSWSFSRYITYKQCPRKAKLQYLDKIAEPPNQYMERGAEIHDQAEAYIKGKLKKLPADLQLFKEEFDDLKERYKKRLSMIVVEDTWAFTKDWDQTKWDDWVGCWVRIKLDCAYSLDDNETLVIIDWKTGKFRPESNADYVEQLELYALAAFIIYPHIETVRPYLVYTDNGMVYPDDEEEELVFTRKDYGALLKLWEKRVRPMMRDKTFAPRPNDKCCWCFYRSSNKANGGGQCEF